jgi:hypothetical protein
MSKAPKAVAAIARKSARESADLARVAIVFACAGALILAGEALPLAL